MKSAELSKLKGLIATVARELGTNGTTTREIVDEVCRRYPGEIRNVEKELADIALKRLVNDANKLRASSSFVPSQGELFAGFGLPAQVSLKNPGEKEPRKKNLSSLTYDELFAWYKTRMKKRAATTKEAIEARRLLKRIKPFAIGDITVQEALKAAEAADEKDEKKGSA